MADKRRGLGRGIGALFPQGQEELKNRPIDVFFTTNNVANAQNAEETSANSAEAKPANKVGTGKTSSATKSTQPKKSNNKQSNSKKSTTDGTELTAGATKPTTVSVRESDIDTQSSDSELLPVPGATFGEIPVEQIVPNTKQPRQVFDEDDLAELTESIREVGVLQPIVIRPLKEPILDNPAARYELIMGERRWRASQAAGKTTVPAVVRRTEDEDLLRDALLENLHRAQLNPLEEAAAYQQLLDDFACTHDELSRRIARSRPQISNTLRLLKLPPLVQRRVAAGVISAGHARALLGLKDAAAMERLAQAIVAQGLSVRATEEIVAMGDDGADAPRTRRSRIALHQEELGALATRLGDRFDTRVKVTMGQRKGKIAIDFATIEDLNRILDLLDEDNVSLGS